MKLSNFYNPIMIWLLRSPLHVFASSSFWVIQFAGRKSGKLYTIPTEYFGENGRYYIFTQKSRTWWKNLQGGVDVAVWLRGKRRTGHAQAFPSDEILFHEALEQYLRHYPKRAKYFDVHQAADGTLNKQDIRAKAEIMVTIVVQLSESG